jgi:hypothetical protein
MHISTRWFPVAVAAAGAFLGTSAPAQEVQIRYKWEKGAVLHFRTVQETHSVMSSGSDKEGEKKSEAARDQTQEALGRAEVLEVGEDGVATVRWTIETLKIESADPRTGRASFDSTRAEDRAAPNPTLAPLAALAGESFTMTIDSRGMVRKVEGMQPITEKMMKNPPPGPQAVMQMQAMKDGYSDEAMARNMERSFGVGPGKAVKPGDTWDSGLTQRLPMMGLARASGEATLERVEGDIAIIKSSFTVALEPGKESEVNPMMAILKPVMTDATGTSETSFDVARGRLQRRQVELTMPIVLTSPSPEGEMKINQLVKTKLTVEHIEGAGDAKPATAPAGS